MDKFIKTLIIFLLLYSPSAALASTEENEAGTRLTSEATEFLDQLLGQGRAKVLVTVQGEKSEARTQTEVLTPIKKNQGADNPRYLPGYALNPKEKESEYDYLQKDQEQTLRQSGLIIKNLHATVILDANLSETQVGLVRRVLPDLLRMDANRGDILTVLRAPLLPPWQRMFFGSEGMRVILQDGSKALFWFTTALVLLAFMGIIGYLIAMRLIHAFVAEVGKVRSAEQAALPAARGGGERIEELPEILPGGVPALGAGEEALGQARPAGALGRRFDFLASQPLADVAEYLAKEKAADLALLFGYLAEAHDSLATQLFAALPAHMQNEVSQNLSKLTSADPEGLAMLENRLRSSVEFGMRGADRLGRILSRIPAQQREGIMGDIMSRDPSMAEKVENSMIPFETLSDLQDAELRRLLTAVPYQEWGVALRAAPEELVRRILMLLPAEAQAALRDYLEVPQPMDKVLDSRSKILSQAYALAAKGLLTANKRDASAMM